MKHFIILLLFLVAAGCGSPAESSVIVQTESGQYVTKTTLAAAATSADAAGKVVVITSPQVVTTAIAWPTDRELKFAPGGYVTFTGAGALTGLKEVYPEWFGGKADGVTDNTAAFTKAIASLTSSTSYGGLLKLSAGTYLTNTVIAQSNLVIQGAGRSTTAAKGGVGGTTLQPYTTASPCLTIGNGTAQTRAITFYGFSMYGGAGSAISGSDGIKINGASQIMGYDFNILQFGGDNISITSSATQEASGIKLSMFDSSYAWGSNYKAVYGASYVTDIGIENYHMTGRNYTGAYSIYLTGGVKLWSFAGWIDTGGDRQGHVYLNSLNDTISGSLNIDGSYGGTAADTTVECNAATRSYPSNVLIGEVMFNKSMLWGDTTKTAGGADAGGGLQYNTVTQQLRAGKIVLSESNASLSNAVTDSSVYADSGTIYIANNAASGGAVYVTGTSAAAGSVKLREIASGAAPSGTIFVDSADHILKFKDSSAAVHSLY